MRIGMRLLLGYFLIVAIAAWFVLSIFLQEVKPGVRRATEGTLIDTATLLAEFARADMLAGNAQNGQLAQAFSRLNQHNFQANIGGITKSRNEYRVYLTDAKGIVLFDSSGKATGQDYSRWNDVWLTLQGKYGARSTPVNVNKPESTVMYVAAPVRDGVNIVGVLSVGKPNSALEPVIHRSERRILWAGVALLGIALMIGFGVVLWINRSIGQLVRYADSVTEEHPLPLPKPGSSELRKLALALETMRLKLEGKSYIEQYVHALTHELKSPLAAIRGAAEILREGPPPEVIEKFSGNILQQNLRMQQLVDNLLRQAKLESRAEITPQPIHLVALFSALCDSREVIAHSKQISLSIDESTLKDTVVEGDFALLEQAIGNLLDNALDFTPPGGEITLSIENADDGIAILVTDTGSGIPDYARDRVFERFYSLPRSNGQKSSGLGLAFVREVARLHRGTITLENRPEGGAQARLSLPGK
ncbi:two-component system sensor histidine kinase CreC [Buttiauxella sp. BIGb0471]|uniref:two-component system sensor histidine kinase CreC n=1 Tax=Buttiauxella sp. BIGb0471 TaxID=2940597 RepID=UPI00216A25A1|nr:two-component system sensor histidine kinase CreC [Buttiauxella sp. BIGb0471]MCS3603334.1 two-component system sensor histidine kinase CreC [Buttiauxella sp. BIGb0471]